MPKPITMPQQSDTMTEGTVVKWLKKEGDKIKAGEIIAEIETDKATMEMEAFDSGTLAVIVAAAGQKAPVGAPIAMLATGSESADEVKKSYAAGASGGAAKAQPIQTAQAGAKASAPASSKPATATVESPNTAELKEPDESVGHGATRETAYAVPPIRQGGNGNERLKVSPLARRVAEDKGIDLHKIRGTGQAGRLVQQDVLSGAQKPAGTAAVATPAAAQLPETPSRRPFRPAPP